jgi:hypothetical protein
MIYKTLHWKLTSLDDNMNPTNNMGWTHIFRTQGRIQEGAHPVSSIRGVAEA